MYYARKLTDNVAVEVQCDFWLGQFGLGLTVTVRGGKDMDHKGASVHVNVLFWSLSADVYSTHHAS